MSCSNRFCERDLNEIINENQEGLLFDDHFSEHFPLTFMIIVNDHNL